VEKNEGDEEKNSLEIFAVPFFWIQILVSCRFVGGSGLIAFTLELTCARLCCWYKHLRKTGQASSFLSFLDP
jgi:nitrate reductase NapE component